MKRMVLTLICIIAGGTGITAETLPKDVVFDDYGAVSESLTGVAGDAVTGSFIVGRNCMGCHTATLLSEIRYQGNIGPTLDGAANRWSEAEFRGLIINAKNTFDATIMPSFYKNDGYIRPGEGYTGKAPSTPLTTILTAQDIEDVVAFLKALAEE